MAAPQDVLRKLGDPTRLRVLTAILDGRKNVSQIVAELGLSQPQVSYHLRMLRESGLATEERDGRWVWYEADRSGGDGHVRELLDLLAGWSAGRGGQARAGARRPPHGGRARRPARAARGTATKAGRASAPAAAPPAPGGGPPAAEDGPAVERPPRPSGDLDDFLL